MITAFYEIMSLSLSFYFFWMFHDWNSFFCPFTDYDLRIFASFSCLTGAQCIDIGVPTLDGIWLLLLPLLLLSMWLSLYYDLPLSL
jgi:hypothetical protein